MRRHPRVVAGSAPSHDQISIRFGAFPVSLGNSISGILTAIGAPSCCCADGGSARSGVENATTYPGATSRLVNVLRGPSARSWRSWDPIRRERRRAAAHHDVAYRSGQRDARSSPKYPICRSTRAKAPSCPTCRRLVASNVALTGPMQVGALALLAQPRARGNRAARDVLERPPHLADFCATMSGSR